MRARGTRLAWSRRCTASVANTNGCAARVENTPLLLSFIAFIYQNPNSVRRRCPYHGHAAHVETASFNMHLASFYIARASPLTAQANWSTACTEPPVCLPRAPIPMVPRRGSVAGNPRPFSAARPCMRRRGDPAEGARRAMHWRPHACMGEQPTLQHIIVASPLFIKCLPPRL
jgi:hypothetical protein